MRHGQDGGADSGSGENTRGASGIYTETLARLYWRQGFLDKALAIYRHLARAQPTNPHLKEQIAVLERQQVTMVHGEAVEKMKAKRLIAHLERWLHHVRQGGVTDNEAGTACHANCF